MRTVLLAEDAAYWVGVITRDLERAGLEVVAVPESVLQADNLAELTAWTWKARGVEAAFVDLSLSPSCTGFKLAEAWRERGWTPTRLLFMTSDEPSPRDLKRADLLGGSLVCKTAVPDWAAFLT